MLSGNYIVFRFQFDFYLFTVLLKQKNIKNFITICDGIERLIDKIKKYGNGFIS